MPDGIFQLPSARELIEIIFQVLFTHSAGDASAPDKIWEEYMQYRTRWCRDRDPEDSFIVGVIMLALDDFTSARTALWDAVKELDTQYGVSKNNPNPADGESKQNNDLEYAKTFIKYSKYLVMAHLTPLREKPNNAKKHISPDDLKRLTALIEYSELPNSFDKSRTLLLAQAYEAASRRACMNHNLDPRARGEQVKEHFERAHGHYAEYGEVPEIFTEWITQLQRSNFCH